MSSPSVPTTATPDHDPQMVLRPLRRWVKVDVSPEVFDHLHLMAKQSGMRIQPYLRKLLAAASPQAAGRYP
jgi:hypothetical protein